jgi:galactokinase
MTLKEKLALIVATQHFLYEVTGEAHVTNEEFAKVSEVMASQFPKVEDDKMDGSQIVDLCVGVLASLTAEVIATKEAAE